MIFVRKFLILISISVCLRTYGQDVDFHTTAHLLPGKTFIKIKQDFYDPYVWALTDHNEVFRINGTDKTVDDFTATFAAYGNLKFIDIAGRSKDTVFVAAATAVIQYKNGSVRLLTKANKFPSTLNSIGIAKPVSLIFTRDLLIASDKGTFSYDMDAEKPARPYFLGASKLYEATYRNEMYKDSLSPHALGDTVKYQPVTIVLESDRAKGYLWTGGKSFGNTIYTATCITASLYQYGGLVSYSSSIWGTEKGLFELNSDASFNSDFPHNHYLPDIKVNKVTTIYGLVALGNAYVGGDASIIKHNLLAGTDKGFYYTSSFYNNAPNGMHVLNFFYDDELGNVAINDLCVNTSSTNRPLCDNGVWLATVDGVYYLTPDYGKYFKNTQANAIYFKGFSQNIFETTICTGSSVIATLNKLKYSSSIIEWYKDNEKITGEGADELKIMGSGTYHAILHDPCSGIRIESEPLKVNVIQGPVFSFNYPDKLNFCDQTPTTLETTKNAAYSYRWFENNMEIPGEKGPVLNLAESGKYRVEIAVCTGAWVSSKNVDVTISNLPKPQITSVKAEYCEGENITLSSNLQKNTAYTINWLRNGVLVDAYKNLESVNISEAGIYAINLESSTGSCSKTSEDFRVKIVSSPNLTFSYPDLIRKCQGEVQTLIAGGSGGFKYRWYKDDVLTGDELNTLNVSKNGKYRVEVSACTESWVTSKVVEVNFIELPQPVITTDKSAYCEGETATIGITVPLDNAYIINWYRDSELLPDFKNKTSLLINTSGTYTADISAVGLSCEKASAPLPINFSPLPTFSIQRTILSTLCDGQDVQLKVSNNNGNVKWSTGETSEQIRINTSGTYSVMITNAAGCESIQQLAIDFFPLPALQLSDMVLCPYEHEAVTLTAPAGFVKYVWNNSEGSNTFKVTEPQTVTLTITDQNGCRATQEIKITSSCLQIKFPNTFTPNGDGVNDTWDIQGLENEKTAVVNVFTRYGTKVFESRGYNQPWNATFKGKKLPPGVYYYLIQTKLSGQPYSGSLTIIY